MFIQPDITFSIKPQFKDSFCVENVREGLVVSFIHHLTATAKGFCSKNVSDFKCPPTLVLLLSKLCLDFQSTSVNHLLSQTDELFNISNSNSNLTTEGDINASMQEAAQELLNYYVRIQGLNISQVINVFS